MISNVRIGGRFQDSGSDYWIPPYMLQDGPRGPCSYKWGGFMGSPVAPIEWP